MKVLTNKQYKDMVDKIELGKEFQEAFLHLTKQGCYEPIGFITVVPIKTRQDYIPFPGGVNMNITLKEVIERHKEDK